VEAVPLDERYLAAVSKGLDAAYARADERVLDPARDRIVIFSDHHRGVGDAADDFRHCELAYTAALGYYLESGYRLVLLGDTEELWEEHADAVLARYRDVLALEAEFVTRGNGLDRFYGNHDDLWARERQIARYLRPVLGDLVVHEGLRLGIDRPGRAPGELFFVHGHQGTADSDRWGRVSKIGVRHIWRPLQRRTGFTTTTPACDFTLRAKHDRAMYEWARSQPHPLVMIAGHTHRPVFSECADEPPAGQDIGELEVALAAATAARDIDRAAAVRAELEYSRTTVRRPVDQATVAPPCYFNTGCCSFPDGTITGIEIGDGEVRLVRWPSNLRELSAPDAGLETYKRVLASEQLEDVLVAVTGSHELRTGAPGAAPDSSPPPSPRAEPPASPPAAVR
jgi:hypothetical protein